jgi:hypothetical protein
MSKATPIVLTAIGLAVAWLGWRSAGGAIIVLAIVLGLASFILEDLLPYLRGERRD